MSGPKPTVICLMGPTASGKTAIALELHAALPVDIVSVDSSQVYREMNIGTAKPTPVELARAPHRLIDIRDPLESYSAAQFCTDALDEIRKIFARGRTPLLVGGTMFYFRALEFGLSDVPAADPEVRRTLSEEARRVGWTAMHDRLRAIDPVRAARINPNDPQRIQRALEIHLLTGRMPSEFAGTAAPSADYRLVKIALWPSDRTVLHKRIAQRFHEMLERGFIAEVEALYRRGDLNEALPSMRTVGYRQAWNYLTGMVDYNEMTTQAIAATRQLAKRQLTWLRRYPEVQRVDCASAPPVREVIEIARRVTVGQGSQL
jgi:tRNA dimethylallyltransferase